MCPTLEIVVNANMALITGAKRNPSPGIVKCSDSPDRVRSKGVVRSKNRRLKIIASVSIYQAYSCPRIYIAVVTYD